VPIPIGLRGRIPNHGRNVNRWLPANRLLLLALEKYIIYRQSDLQFPDLALRRKDSSPAAGVHAVRTQSHLTP
jgi:hypothetical protein